VKSQRILTLPEQRLSEIMSFTGQSNGIGNQPLFHYRLCMYAKNRKVAGLIPDEVNVSIFLILSAALGPLVYSATNRNKYQKH
jgi:hypothetical protein